MKILHTVEYYSPSVGGAQEVVRQVSERLAARGHDVTVATSRIPGRERRLGGVAIEEFDVRGNAVNGFVGDVEGYQAFLRDGEFDVMLNYAAQQWATDLALPLLEELPYAKALAPCGFSGLYLPDYADYFAGLTTALSRYGRVVLHSATYRDAEFMRRHGIDRITVIPNGAAAEEFDVAAQDGFRRRHGISPEAPVILTVGAHTGLKGHGLVLEAFQHMQTRRGVLVVIGNSQGYGCLRDCRRKAREVVFRSAGRKRVRLLDPPRHEVVAAYDAADIFAFASAIECSPLVLFEAAASGTPFISLAVGNTAEIAEWTGGGTVLPTRVGTDGYADADPAVLAAALDDLLLDPGRRASLGAAGKRAWNERFRWDDIAGRYEALYADLVSMQGKAAVAP